MAVWELSLVFGVMPVLLILRDSIGWARWNGESEVV